MGAPLGNVNAIKGKPWGDALRRALARREQSGEGRDLNAIAEVLLEKANEGDLAAIKELGDRLDGKPAQSIGGDPEGTPVSMSVTWTAPPRD